MNLGKKTALAARTLNVGKGRIMFVKSRLNEIKEAITKQDIRDLQKEGAIIIKQAKGRKKVVKNKSRSQGNVRKRVNKRKRNYIIMTRKLRKYIAGLKKRGEMSNADFIAIRKKIRNKEFESIAHMKEFIRGGKNA